MIPWIASNHIRMLLLAVISAYIACIDHSTGSGHSIKHSASSDHCIRRLVQLRTQLHNKQHSTKPQHVAMQPTTKAPHSSEDMHPDVESNLAWWLQFTLEHHHQISKHNLACLSLCFLVLSLSIAPVQTQVTNGAVANPSNIKSVQLQCVSNMVGACAHWRTRASHSDIHRAVRPLVCMCTMLLLDWVVSRPQMQAPRARLLSSPPSQPCIRTPLCCCPANHVHKCIRSIANDAPQYESASMHPMTARDVSSQVVQR